MLIKRGFVHLSGMATVGFYIGLKMSNQDSIGIIMSFLSKLQPWMFFWTVNTVLMENAWGFIVTDELMIRFSRCWFVVHHQQNQPFYHHSYHTVRHRHHHHRHHRRHHHHHHHFLIQIIILVYTIYIYTYTQPFEITVFYSECQGVLNIRHLKPQQITYRFCRCQLQIPTISTKMYPLTHYKYPVKLD